MAKLVIMVFMARSGSKYVASILGQHPEIVDFGELFHGVRSGDDNHNVLENLLGKLAELANNKSKISLVQYRYPQHFQQVPEFARIMENNHENIVVLHCMRRNKLKGAISQQNAERLKKQTGSAHLRDKPDSRLDPLQIDVERAISETLLRTELDEVYSVWLAKNFQYFRIYYEDLVAAPKATCESIADFLGVENDGFFDVRKTNLTKVTDDDLKVAISNFSDLQYAASAAHIDQWLFSDSIVKASEKSKGIYARKNLVRWVVNELENRQSVKYLGPASSASRWVKMLRKKNPDSKSESATKAELKIITPKLPTHTEFLEDTILDGRRVSLIAKQGTSIIESHDNGKTFRAHELGKNVARCRTIMSGKHLAQMGEEPGKIFLYDSNWQLEHEVTAGSSNWLGTWSVDQSSFSGTICWAEYPYSAKEVSVWCSKDEGQTWKKSFTIEGSLVANPSKHGSIRHFHLVQADSSIPGRWYLSSGDRSGECKMWISDDDARTWSELQNPLLEGDSQEIPEVLKSKVFRFTSIVQDKEFIYWVTDDTFKGKGARAIRMSKNEPNKLTVFEGSCGNNEVRNLVRYGKKHALAFSEAKLEREKATISLIDLDSLSIIHNYELVNLRGGKSNFTNSVSSKEFDSSGLCLTFSDNQITYPNPKMIGWRMTPM